MEEAAALIDTVVEAPDDLINFGNFGLVYFIHAISTDYVKIGWTRDISKRFRQLATASPHKLQLLGIHPGEMGLEKAYHSEFSSYRHNLEWFHMPSIVHKWLRYYLKFNHRKAWDALGKHDHDLVVLHENNMTMIDCYYSDLRRNKEVLNG